MDLTQMPLLEETKNYTFGIVLNFKLYFIVGLSNNKTDKSPSISCKKIILLTFQTSNCPKGIFLSVSQQ